MRRVLVADARAIPLADSCVQSVVTSPPYWGLRDYSLPNGIGLEPELESYVQELTAVFREVRRVLKDDGTVWLNLGDMYAGANYRGGGVQTSSPKQASNNGSTDFMARKAPPIPRGLKRKDLIGLPWRVAFALQRDGWYLRSEIIWAKRNPMPESIRDRPTKSHETIFLFTKREKYFYDHVAIKEPASQAGAEISLGEKSFARRQADGMGRPRSGNAHATTYTVGETRNKRDVWTFSTEPFPEAHFATFPKALVEPCVLAGSRVDDIVLDPFAGSGTVGLVTEIHGRHFVGLDLQPEYVAMANRRLRGRSTP